MLDELFKLGFGFSVLASLGLHVFDVFTDVLVTVGLWTEDKVWFWVSVMIIIIGSLFSSIASTLMGAVKAAAEGETDTDEEGRMSVTFGAEFPPSATTCGSCLCGLIQLEIFIDAFYSIKNGSKTPGYALSRAFEGMVESSAQSLLQLFIALKRSTDTTTSSDLLLYLSIGTSVLSLTFGLTAYEKYVAKNDVEGDGGKYYFPYRSKYFFVLLMYRFFEVSARMGILACAGALLSGWAIGGMILFDWAIMAIPFFVASVRKDGVGEGLEGFFLSLCLSFCALAFVGVFPFPFLMVSTYGGGITCIDLFKDWQVIVGFIGRYFWLIKGIEGLVFIPFILMHIVNGANRVFLFFGCVSIASFVLQYPFLYYVLKYASNANVECTTPKMAGFCCSHDDSRGGIISMDEYRKRKREKQTKVVPA
eukprot:g848.t1